MPAEPERLKILTRELVAHEDAIQCVFAERVSLCFLVQFLPNGFDNFEPVFRLLNMCRLTGFAQGMPRKVEAAGVAECLEKLKRLV